MHAHLIPYSPGSHAAPPVGALASCRLDGSAGAGWLLALTDDDTSGPYVVEDHWQAAQGQAAWAAVTEFDGPRDAAQQAADRRSGRERVWPAASQVEGTVAAVVLRGPDGAMVAVGFATDEASLEAAAQAIQSTPLLPGEEPSLLGGPNRYATCRVVDDGVLSMLRTRATSGVSA